MLAPSGDETDDEADERLGISCVNKKMAGGEEMKKEKKLVLMDTSNRVVVKSAVVGYFAMWVVRQSPYSVPEELEKGIDAFNKYLTHSGIEGNTEYIESTYTELLDNIKTAITNSDIITSWNTAKKGAGIDFVSSHSEPDYDYIDLDALASNIALSVWLELSYDDGWLE